MGAKFCDECGAPVSDGRPVTPPHLAERILADRSRLEGERRTVTVLFADAKGFTPISEQIGEEEAYGLVQGCTQRMVDAVHRYDGFVNQFAGDGIMAIFGAPIAHEDSARRAVAAALDMQEDLEVYAAEVKRRHPAVACAFRVGLNTGPVVVGTIGDDLGMDYTAVGDTTNLASRMEEMAEPGSVYLTDHTYRQVVDFFECESLGPQPVKGKSAPVAIYKALRPKAVRTRFEAATRRGLSPFVGRERELTVLTDFLAHAEAGGGQVVLVAGEAGIGKTRLMLEVRRRLVDRDVAWIGGQCISYGEGIPYLPVIDLIKSAFGVVDEDDDAAIIAKVDAGTAGWEPATQKTVPYLKFLLQVDPGDPSVESMDPLERRAGILDAVRALVVEQSRERPLAVVVEDLHWADEQSEVALEAMLDVVPRSRVLFVGTFRPGYEHGLEDVPQTNRLALAHLAGDESVALASSVLRASSLPPELAGLITSKAEGNPLFIEEVTKALVESGVLADGDDGLALTRPADEVDVPDTIQEVILSRIDLLEEEAKHAIQLASVIGREFTVRLLGRISNLKAELDGVLGRLKSLELIYEASFFPELAYMFKHALTHDVAYSTLLGDRRRSLHLTVAQAIEELYAERLPEQYETLAYHYEEAGQWERALDYLERSGDKAFDAAAHEEALDFFARALRVAQRVDAVERIGPIAFKRARLAANLERLDEAVADFDAAINAAETIGDDDLLVSAYFLLARTQILEAHDFTGAEATLDAMRDLPRRSPVLEAATKTGKLLLYLVTGRHDEVTDDLVRPETNLARVNNPLLAVIGHVGNAQAAYWTGNFARPIDTIESLGPWVGGTLDVRLQAAWVEGLVRGHRGEYERALDLLMEALELCERTGSFFWDMRALNSVGWVYGELQDAERALGWNLRSLEAATAVTLPDFEVEGNARLNIADNLRALGRPDEADEHYRIVEAVYRDPTPPDALMLWRYSQHLLHSKGELLLERGDIDGALACANECLDVAEGTNSKKNVVKARRLRGQVRLAGGDPGGAEDEVLVALEVADRIGNPGQLWKTHAALGAIRGPSSYRDAMVVIERVASSLSDRRLRETFLSSAEVIAIRDGANA